MTHEEAAWLFSASSLVVSYLLPDGTANMLEVKGLGRTA